jgi:hypothetical protein
LKDQKTSITSAAACPDEPEQGRRLLTQGKTLDQPMQMIPPEVVALDVEHLELADQIAENDGAFTRHVHSSIFALQHLLLHSIGPEKHFIKL